MKPMDEERIRLALIYGSTRKGRFCETVARWASAEIEAHGGFELEPIDPAQHGAEQVERRIARADAFVVVTPEYNHGYPAPLKATIDSVYDEWQAKPVGFVSYGGVSGGIRAVEQLRQVFAELHAVTVRDAVSFANGWDQFDEAGRPRDAARARRSISTMLDRLRWWALALRAARRASPDQEVA
ncbi:MAG: NADPH-dependent FMN reductase [Gammaproteobacteria bacterium]